MRSPCRLLEALYYAGLINDKNMKRTPIQYIQRAQCKQSSGQAALISIFFVMMIMLSAAFGVSSLALNEHKVANENAQSNKSFFAADAGVEDAIYRYKTGKNVSPSFTIILNGATSDVEIESISPTERKITATGDASNRIRAASAEIIIQPGASFSMALQAGTGGIKLGEGSAIYGNVYSNGSVIGDSNASTSGNVSIAGSQIALHQFYDTHTGDYNIGQVGSKIDIAQSFIPTADGTISQVSLFIKKFNTPGNRYIKIVTSSGESPTKTVLASGLISANQVTGNFAWINIPLDSTPQLSAGTTYWIIFDSSLNGTNYYVWGYDVAGAGSKYSPNWNASSPLWSPIVGKMNYKIWFGDAPNIAKDIEVGGDLRAHTIQTSKVHGNAFYQTIDQYSLDWLNTYDGGTASISTDLPTENMPISDAQIDAWKEEAEDPEKGGSTYDGPCPYVPTSGSTIGPMRINCDFNTSNSTSLNIMSPIWVTGNMNIDNSNTFVLELSAGEDENTDGIIIADGKINPGNSFAACGSAGYSQSQSKCNPSNGSYLTLISTYSGGDQAITLSNASDGAVFYAPYGEIKAGNGLTINSATAKQLTLGNNSSIKYEDALAAMFFSSQGGTSQWGINSWQEIVP